MRKVRDKIIVVGAGIGGLTAALCLARCGAEVQIIEQADALTEVGAGIQLSPNCIKVLRLLGLESVLLQIASRPVQVRIRHWRSGAQIAETPLNGTDGDQAEQRYGAPYCTIHRADLITLLATAVSEHAGVSLHTGVQVHQIRQTDVAVNVSTGAGNFTADAVIGADGIHSIVRAQVLGEQAARFTGHVAWRALVPMSAAAKVLQSETAEVTAWWGPRRHFVHYPVRRGEWLNCVCIVEQAGWTEESWRRTGTRSELLGEFADWHAELSGLIQAAASDSLFKWALYDRRPLPQWGKHRVTLLGDACHPMLPFMAQGGAMAIEDAAILANCLKSAAIPRAFLRYADLRRARTTWVQQVSRRNGWVYHLGGPVAWARNQVAPWAMQRTTQTLFQFNPLTVA